MILTEGQKKEVMKLNEEEFKLFIRDMEIALMYQTDDKGDFEYFYEDVEGRDGVVEHEDPHEVFQDEIFYRSDIVNELAQARDIEKFCHNIKYINASMFDIYAYGDEECFEDRILGEKITMDLVKDILRYNS